MRSTSCPSGSRRGPGEDAACVKRWFSHVVGSHVVSVVTSVTSETTIVTSVTTEVRTNCNSWYNCHGQSVMAGAVVVAVTAATTVVDDDSFDNCRGQC